MAGKKAGLPRACGARNDEVKSPTQIRGGKHRDMQVARTGGRKLFNEERRGVFLEWFAATANVSLSAEMAGINYKTAFRHRMDDADFAADWDRALEQGVARAKAKQLESRGRPRPGIDGDLDAPEMGDVDPQIVIAMIREGERRLAGYPKSGAPPRVATNAEVREALAARLRAFRARVRAERAGRVVATPESIRGKQPSEGLDRHGAIAPRDDEDTSFVIASEARQSSGSLDCHGASTPRDDEGTSPVIASEARQSSEGMDRHGASAPRDDGEGL